MHSTTSEIAKIMRNKYYAHSRTEGKITPKIAHNNNLHRRRSRTERKITPNIAHNNNHKRAGIPGKTGNKDRDRNYCRRKPANRVIDAIVGKMEDATLTHERCNSCDNGPPYGTIKPIVSNIGEVDTVTTKHGTNTVPETLMSPERNTIGLVAKQTQVPVNLYHPLRSNRITRPPPFLSTTDLAYNDAFYLSRHEAQRKTLDVNRNHYRVWKRSRVQIIPAQMNQNDIGAIREDSLHHRWRQKRRQSRSANAEKLDVTRAAPYHESGEPVCRLHIRP